MSTCLEQMTPAERLVFVQLLARVALNAAVRTHERADAVPAAPARDDDQRMTADHHDHPQYDLTTR